MVWIILGLVFLVVTYLSLKGTVIEEYIGEHHVGERHVSLWMLLVLGLLYMIPIGGIIIFLSFIIIFCVCTTCKPKRYSDRLIIKLSDKNCLHRILKNIAYFLTKSI